MMPSMQDLFFASGWQHAQEMVLHRNNMILTGDLMAAICRSAEPFPCRLHFEVAWASSM